MPEETKLTTNGFGHPRAQDDIENSKPHKPKTVTIVKTKKPKRKDKSDLGENFVAPDGGWGWLVAIASGMSTLVTFALMQQYGIIFRERLQSLGLNSSQMTTIINTQAAISSVTGLVNGPMFRRFSYRQVAVVGALLTFLGLFLAAFSDTFILYMVTISFIYGIGRGFTVSASSLAVNTFFKINRRKATAFQWTIAGVGPMFLPYMSTYLLSSFGVMGTVLVYSAISLNTLACALVYQPVKWHVKKISAGTEALKVHKIAIQDDDDEEKEENPMFETADTETTMMARANDGWYGSKLSLSSNRYRRSSSVSSMKYHQQRTRTYSREMENGYRMKEIGSKATIKDSAEESAQIIAEKKEADAIAAEIADEIEEAERQLLPWYKKLALFFDLDLLRDPTYLSLVLGLTVINFSEVNFAVLTPFILSDFGFDYKQIALAMSLLATTDLIARFSIPFATSRINLSNKIFFIIGVIGLSVGRIIVAHSRDINVVLFAFAWMGANKALRVVFWNLIIPGYVPLKRLPAAAGLQLLISGLFTLAFGPIIGLIRDSTNYSVAIHCLNGFCFVTIIIWVLQDCIKKPSGTMKEKEAS